MEKRRRGWKLLGAYAALFAVGFAVCWQCVLRDGASPIWQTDGLMQHYPFMVYIGSWLREAVSSLLHGGGVKRFDFALGFGEDVLGTLNYYGLGDPLLMLVSVLFGGASSEVGYFALMALRSGCAGLAGIALAKHFRMDDRSALFAGWTYALSVGLFSAALIRQAMFANPYIHLPLMLLGVEHVLDRKKPWLLSLATLLAALGGFYFLYCSSLLMLVYAVVRQLTRNQPHPLRALPGEAARAVGWYALGLGLAAVVFLPTTLAFLSGQRLSGGLSLKEFRLHYAWDEYLRFPLALATYRGAGAAQMMTMLGMSGAAIRMAKRRREDRFVRVLTATVGAMLLIPATGWALNGFSYEATRWSYAVSLLAAMLGGWGLEDALNAPKRARRGMAIGTAALIAYLAAMTLSGRAGSRKWMLAAAACIAATVGAIWIRARWKRVGTVLLAAAVLINVASAYQGVWLQRRGEMVPMGESLRAIESSAYAGLPETDGAARTDMTVSASGAMLNGGALEGVPGTTVYNSTISQSTFRLMRDVENSGLVHVNSVAGLDRRAALEALWSVERYVGAEASAPYGFEQVQDGLWQNAYALPVAYAVTGAISMDEYAALSPLEKQWALLQCAALEETELAHAQVNQSVSEIEIANVEMTNIEVQGDVWEVGEDAVLRLGFDAPEDCELYLELEGFAFEDGEVDLGNRVTAQSGSARAEFCLIPAGFELDLARERYLVNVGYDAQARTVAEIRFDRAGTYRLSGIKLWIQPMRDFPDMIAQLQARGLQNISVGDDEVTGTISLDAPAALVTSIPYSRGWTIWANGRRVEAKASAGAFLACELEAGDYEIRLSYQTPGLRAGAILSAVSIAALAVLSRRKARKEEIQ